MAWEVTAASASSSQLSGTICRPFKFYGTNKAEIPGNSGVTAWVVMALGGGS